MGKYGALLVYHLLLIFILTISFSCKANNDEERKVYIVYMGALPDEPVYSPSSHHLSILQSVIEGSSASNSLVRSYKRSFNGFAAKLTDKERQKLASMTEVVSIFPRQIFQTQTTRSWDFLGLLKTTNRNPTVESDTIVGVIDTGIWPELESFSDKGFSPPPKKWKGACNGGLKFTCNNKIIGARFYPLFARDWSARDFQGHGSHTASTAAGNYVKDVSFYGFAKGTGRGGVPSGRIAAYKVCNAVGCYSDAMLAAFDDAIADGVDIITISIGARVAQVFHADPIALGAFHAMKKGILTVNSAGNSGPSLGTSTSLAPWLMTVAASSIDRRIIDKVVLSNGATIIGNGVNSFILNGTAFPLIHGKNATRQCLDTTGVCESGCLESDLVKGKIVLCDDSSDGNGEAFRAGALGVITTNDRLNDVSLVEPLPSSALNHGDYTELLSYLSSTNDPRATIIRSEVISDAAAPKTASFSSRGPNVIVPEIMKPDISAPGMEILAAYSPESSPSGDARENRSVKYNIISGTSMACPHVAGAAAYVKTFHPDWSPSAIKSSLMTTASVVNKTEDSHEEFDYGSGQVNPLKALHPGLVYEASEGDYIKFLCSIGYNEEKLRRLSGDNSTHCPKGSDKRTPKDLNYPSMTAEVPAGVSFTVNFHRRVKNVGHENSTYKAKIFSSSLTEVQVVPAVLSFKSLHEEKSFDVIVKGGALSQNSMVSASLVWSDGSHSVKSPIVLHNIRGQT